MKQQPVGYIHKWEIMSKIDRIFLEFAYIQRMLSHLNGKLPVQQIITVQLVIFKKMKQFFLSLMMKRKLRTFAFAYDGAHMYDESDRDMMR